MKQLQNQNGGRYMGQDSQAEQKILLEAQIRECFGRVVYSHKCQEKCADIALRINSNIKLLQIILSAITTAGLFVVVFGESKIAAIFATIVSTILLALNAYTKNFDLAGIAEKHKEAASELWNIRESYLSLLTDFLGLSVEDITKKRDELQQALANIYKGAPRTNSKAYQEARKALKVNEELTFSDAEIDAFLPKALRKCN